jgi:hypothetical protein
MDGDVDPCFSYKKDLQIWWSSAHFPHLFLAFLKDRKRVRTAFRDKKVKKISDFNFGDSRPHIMQAIEGSLRLAKFKNVLKHPLVR